MRLQLVFLVCVLLLSTTGLSQKEKSITIYLIGDSTMADYSGDYDPGKDYLTTRYPMTGWGQVFQPLFTKSNVADFKNLFVADRVIVDNRARGGRSTRTFFQEGRWRSVYDELKKDDLVIIQFGHNDAAESKTERFVNIEGYKEFLRLYISQTRERGGIPIVLTPVCRNYPWNNGHLENVHGDYPAAAREVAEEMSVLLIDLNELSMDAFSEKGKNYVTEKYFMNVPPGKFDAYPEGLSDNTHFQPEGAEVVAGLVFEALKTLEK
jgi:lysophospholipase L1-like esterase